MNHQTNFFHRLILIILIAGFLPAAAVVATTPTDLDRDVRVLEQVLKGLLQEHGNAEISTTYISGYGVLLQVKPRLQLLRFAGVRDGAIQVDRNLADQSDKIQNTIKTFFTDYMIRLGNLPANEHIAVLMESDFDRNVFGALAAGTGSVGPVPPSRIFYSAQKSHIEQVNSGRLSKDDFISRMTIQKYDIDDSPRDLRVLENIIKNEFAQDRESTGSISTISGTHIPGLGIWMDVSLGFAGGGLARTFESFNITPADIKGIHVKSANGDDSEITVEVNRRSGIDSIATNIARVVEGSVAQLNESMAITLSSNRATTAATQENYDNSIALLKELLLEYGNLIRDIESDDSIIVQVRLRQIRQSTSEIPATTQLTLQKSLIESYQAGRINIEQAKNRIEITKR